MATVKFYESSLAEPSKEIKVKPGIKIKTVIDNYFNDNNITNTVEVYFPDTDETKFIPLENDTCDIAIVVNGVEKDVDYKIKKNDQVVIICMQHDSGTWKGFGIFVMVVAALVLTIASYGTLAPAAAALLTLGGLALGAVGLGMFLYGSSLEQGTSSDGSSELGAEKEGLLTLNGGSNEPIIGKNYPLILGKHLINPYIIGSPYHETYNRSITSKSKDIKKNVPINMPRGIKDYYEEYKEKEEELDISDLKLDHYDDGQYYKALYCVGYGPLKLTDFRIGDTKLSYNRPFKSKGMDKLIENIVKLQNGGSVNVLKRPVIPSEIMQKEGGWDIGNSYATLYTSAYPYEGSGYNKYFAITPIVCDKVTGQYIKILTNEELMAEGQKIYNSFNDSDKTYTDELGIVVGKPYWVGEEPSDEIKELIKDKLPKSFDSAEAKALGIVTTISILLHDLSDLYVKRVIAATTMHGLLKGTEDEYDAGDILRKWKNNDVQLEILQAGDIVQENSKWSSIYPFTVKEEEVNSAVLFAHDYSIKQNADVIYKGVSVPCGYRTNTVRFSKSCPYRIEVELDMPQGLYGTWVHNEGDNGKSYPFYKQLPVNVAVQWRYASQDEDSSNAESPDGWNTFDYEILNERNVNEETGELVDTLVRKKPIQYDSTVRLFELEQNLGIDPHTKALHDNNEEWVKAKADVFELSSNLCTNNYQWKTEIISTKALDELQNRGIIKYSYQKYNTYKKDRKKVYEWGWRWLLGIPKYHYEDCGTPGVSMPYVPGMAGVYRTPDHTRTNEKGDEEKYSTSESPMEYFYAYKIEKGEYWDPDSFDLEYVDLPSCYDKNGKPITYTIPQKIKYLSKVVKPENRKNVYKKEKYNTNERRYTFVKEFTAEECQKLLNIKGKKSDFFDSVEVRVIRLTPCFINEAGTNDKYNSGQSYEDLVKWSYIRTWSFDKDAYTNAVEHALDNDIDPLTLEPATYGERPIPAEDLNKFCYIALSLKQDVAETGGRSLEKVNCIATSMQPNYDMQKHIWTPTVNSETGELEELKLNSSESYFYISFDKDDKKRYVKLPITDYSDNIIEKDLYEKLGFKNIEEGLQYDAESQYKYGLTTEYANMFFSKRDGNDYYKKIRNSFFTNTMYSINTSCYPSNNAIYNSEVPRMFLDSNVLKEFETQNSASAAIYSLIGNHLKGDAKTLDCVELRQFGDFYEFCNDVTDGSLEEYKSPNITYPEWLKEDFDKSYNATKDTFAELYTTLKEAPVNAVWRNCYDYIINELLLQTGISDYYKQEFIKYLENEGLIGEPDGKLHIQYRCNGVISSQIKMETLLQNILLTGRATYRRSENNKYEPIIGRKNQYPVTVLNQRNCITISNVRNFEDTISGMNISYIDENDNYDQNNIYVMDDGESEKYPTKKIIPFKLDYVTNALQMRSLARFNLACTLYQKEQYTRSIGIMGFALNLGDLVLLQDDTLLVGTDRGGRIKEVLKDDATNTIIGFITDEPFEYRSELNDEGLCKFGCSVVQPQKYGNSRVATIRCGRLNDVKQSAKRAVLYEENEIYYRYVNDEYVMASPQPAGQESINSGEYYVDLKSYEMQEGITNVFVFENPIFVDTETSEDSTIDGVYYTYRPEVDNLIAFGEVGSITTKAVIMSIKPKDKGTFDLSLVPYNEKLYEYGEKFPFFKSNMTTPNREGNDYDFSTPSTTASRAEDMSESQNLLANAIFGSDEPPQKPTVGLVYARRDNIQLSCIQTGTMLKDAVNYYEWEIVRGDGTVETIKTSSSETQYVFDRYKDGYPEKSQLEEWVVRVRVQSIYGQNSEWSPDTKITFQPGNYTWIPTKPTVIQPIAKKEGFEIYWNTEETLGTSKYKVLVYKTTDTEDELLFESDTVYTNKFNYIFNREVDKYPEREDLGKYKVVIKHFNEAYDEETPKAAVSDPSSVNYDYYGTWKIGALTKDVISKDVIDRTVTIKMTIPSTSGDLEYYGDTKYKISIRRVGIDRVEDSTTPAEDELVRSSAYPIIQPDEDDEGNPIWYEPDLYSNPLGEETSYRTDKVDGYILSSSRYSQTLPLAGQSADKPNIANTIYEYKIVATNESGKETEPFIMAVTALCTSLRDIVKANANYKDLYVEKLSAINANIGLIQQGGFGDFSNWDNFWALSDLSSEDSGVEGGIKRGAFRVGDENEFITVIPPHSHIGEEGADNYINNPSDNYKIVIKAGNITLSTDGTQFDAGTYIYDENDKTKRMKLTADGIIIQQEVSPDNWEARARMTADTEGNLTITNSGTNDPTLPVNGTGVSSDTIIYHFEQSLKDNNQGNAGLLEFENVTFNRSSVVKDQEYCINGTVSRKSTPGDMCLFNDSDTIFIGNKLVNLKYDSVRSDIDDWNAILNTDRFKWGNK